MKISILTIFPDMFNDFLSTSIIKRAIEKEKVNIEIINIRDYTTYNHHKVDDEPYGGGSGMVLMIEPIYNALKEIKTKDSFVILTDPKGKTLTQNTSFSLKDKKHIIIICGHYEGIDERITNFIDMKISIGNFVLTGGELPAMVITDSVVRLIDGVINKESLKEESFNDEYYDYPVYTRPSEFMGMKVPDVLLSGDHQKIKEYRDSLKKKVK